MYKLAQIQKCIVTCVGNVTRRSFFAVIKLESFCLTFIELDQNVSEAMCLFAAEITEKLNSTIRLSQKEKQTMFPRLR